MSEYFQRVANDVLKASEELSTRLEEGIYAMMNGELPNDSSSGSVSDAINDAGAEFLQEEMEIEEELMGSPLEGIAESVLGDLMQNQVKPQGLMENFEAFRSAITWTEPFIMGLLAFQLMMFLFSLLVTRPSVGLTPRLCLMISIAGLVRMAERINGLGARNWEKFATQNYFDRQGVFFAIMISGPLLLDCLMMLILFVREAASLLVTVKTNELKRKKAEKKKSEGKGKKKKEQ